MIEVQRVFEGAASPARNRMLGIDAMNKQGNVIKPTSPEDAAKFFRSEGARYAALAKKANVSLD